MKALLVPVTGEPKEVTVADNSPDQIKELQHLVGGYVESVHTTRLVMKNNMMLVDEDGRVKGKPRNIRAEQLSGYPSLLVGDAVIVGYVRDPLNGDTWGNYHA